MRASLDIEVNITFDSAQLLHVFQQLKYGYVLAAVIARIAQRV